VVGELVKHITERSSHDGNPLETIDELTKKVCSRKVQ
jgi:hypothetical protein